VAKTPEGDVKKQVSALLAGPDIYVFMPVQQGFGKAGLDYHCTLTVRNTCFAFFVETKRPGKELTPRQAKLVREHRGRHAKVFVIDNWANLLELERWIARMRALN
jgi:hypothetical protein